MESHQAMIQLVLMLAIGLFLLALCLAIFVRAVRETSGNSSNSDSELSKVLRLSSLECGDPGRIFSDADYRVLASEPRLRPLARELWQDRRLIALKWLRGCQRDVIAMWRFRRFLVSRGASNTVREELSATCRSLGLIFLLAVLRVSVWLWGPYAFTMIVVGIRDDARQLRSACTRTLERLPQGKRPQVAAEWRSFQAAL